MPLVAVAGLALAPACSSSDSTPSTTSASTDASSAPATSRPTGTEPRSTTPPGSTATTRGSGVPGTAASTDSSPADPRLVAASLVAEDLGMGWQQAPDDLLRGSDSTSTTRPPPDVCPGVPTPAGLSFVSSPASHMVAFTTTTTTDVIVEVLASDPQASETVDQARAEYAKCDGLTTTDPQLPFDNKTTMVPGLTLGDDSFAVRIDGYPVGTSDAYTTQYVVVGRKGDVLVALVVSGKPDQLNATTMEPIVAAANLRLGTL